MREKEISSKEKSRLKLEAMREIGEVLGIGLERSKDLFDRCTTEQLRDILATLKEKAPHAPE